MIHMRSQMFSSGNWTAEGNEKKNEQNLIEKCDLRRDEIFFVWINTTCDNYVKNTSKENNFFFVLRKKSKKYYQTYRFVNRNIKAYNVACGYTNFTALTAVVAVAVVVVGIIIILYCCWCRRSWSVRMLASVLSSWLCFYLR